MAVFARNLSHRTLWAIITISADTTLWRNSWSRTSAWCKTEETLITFAGWCTKPESIAIVASWAGETRSSSRFRLPISKRTENTLICFCTFNTRTSRRAYRWRRDTCCTWIVTKISSGANYAIWLLDIVLISSCRTRNRRRRSGRTFKSCWALNWSRIRFACFTVKASFTLVCGSQKVWWFHSGQRTIKSR